MPSQKLMAAVAAFLFPSFIAALPQLSDATSPNPSVFYHRSSDPACNSKACVADCRDAAAAVCNSPELELSPTLSVTVNDCTAYYMYEIGNTVPTKESCYAAYTRINDAGAKGAGPDGCGGTVGGALGYDANGNRTNDPLFVLYPKDGNGNCFKAPGDDSPPKPREELSNGQKLPLDSCPNATSRRRRSALQRLESRTNPAECIIGEAAYLAGCSAICIEWVTTAAWWTGWLVAAGYLACAGGCYGVDLVAAKRCFDNLDKVKPRAIEPGPRDPCSNLNNWGFECPAMQSGLLSAYSCPGTVEAEGSGSVVSESEGSGINT